MSTEELPTLYEYYTKNGITTGLSDKQPQFTLNNKEITLYSGAMHYFRVPPEYWRDRLRKIRAAGLNCVETYVPWNLHEPQMDTFDFGEKPSNFGPFFDLSKFIKLAQDEDLLVIVRPGPYICAEWEFGGLPSWLLRFKDIKIRTCDPAFMKRVTIYFKELFKLLVPLQFTKGGPIIAFQIENEYGNIKEENKDIDTNYLLQLKDLFVQNGIVELLFTSDTPSNGFSGTIPGVLATANFQEDPDKELALLEKFQPGKPSMVMEFWTGWFDHWLSKHETRSPELFADVLEKILQRGASFNMYMFHGGTNWGFLNGANVFKGKYEADVTSYDYDAPLNEQGEYTEKYRRCKELVAKYNKVLTKVPELPTLAPRKMYEAVPITKQITLGDLLEQVEKQKSPKLLPMELLSTNDNNGQQYGYIVYRTKGVHIKPNSVLKIVGQVHDTLMVLINGDLVSKPLKEIDDLNGFGYWRTNNSVLNLGETEYHDATIDLIVENWGRINYGKLDEFNQFKGLVECEVFLNNFMIQDWEICPLEFNKKWTTSLSNWSSAKFPAGPTLYMGVLNVKEACDTFLDMRKWQKGIVIVNGFVLARYCHLGPQRTAYLPAPFFKKGDNEILIFEHFNPDTSIHFVDMPILS